MRAREWVLASYPDRATSLENFQLRESELSPLRAGEVLVQTGIFGMAPSLRFRMTRGGNGLPGMQPGETFTASGMGLVLESRSDVLQAGDYVYGDVGWRDFGVFGPEVYLKRAGRHGSPLTNSQAVLGGESAPAGPFQIDDFLGLLGGVGMAAYIGLFTVGQAQSGETVVVTAAAGGIGNIACQLAKLAGMEVYGTTRDAGKAAWLREAVGIGQEPLPEAVDLLFDNVGGPGLAHWIPKLRKRSGRVVVCGLIAEYESGETTEVPLNTVVFRDLALRGFFADHYLEVWPEALDRMAQWLAAGQLRRHYDIVDGFENAPSAYLRLYRGETNRGKLMVRAAEIRNGTH